MYAYIKGVLEEVFEDSIIIENQGIGYRVRVPMRVLDELPMRGSSMKIFTYLYVREDAFSLLGFFTRGELSMFQLLLNVSGIGPKGALAILSTLSPNDIRFAVMSSDDKAIAKAPGIGKKSAQRLIIELKDKVSMEDALESFDPEAVIVPDSTSVVKKEAIEALVALGYRSSDAAKTISSISITEQMDVEEVLKAALKQMAFL